MCDRAVYTRATTIKYVPQCYKTQEMYNKVVPTCFLEFNSIPD